LPEQLCNFAKLIPIHNIVAPVLLDPRQGIVGKLGYIRCRGSSTSRNWNGHTDRDTGSLSIINR
jgi:hypothetical protein